MRKVLALLLFIFLSLPTIAQAQEESPFRLQFISEQGSTLDEISRGETGSGTLVIFYADNAQPSLLVQFRNDATGAYADVFDNTEQTISRTLTWLDESVGGLRVPVVQMHAPDGWWVRDGVTNYNLDITIVGKVYAMWGAETDLNFPDSGWMGALPAGFSEPTVRVRVADPAQTGVPQWDLRELLPPFSGQGYYRTNYAERRCDSPLALRPTVVAAWPYIAQNPFGFEQPIGQLAPPIVVDWERGVVTDFAELVTVRNQSCSYSLYSITPLRAGISVQNFETPFAFYDLAEANNGYPNLILRTEHYEQRDRWSLGLRAAGQANRPVPDSTQRIRYSWRTAAGDGTWDYKVEVMGTHEYTDTVEIADGLFTIYAPPYQQFPEWIQARKWPVTTFVAVENPQYRSQEGIYAFTPIETRIGHLFGWAAVADDAFDTIERGLRGEYWYETQAEPLLYYSPIDERLHLRAAEGGIWQIDEETTLRMYPLDDSPYLRQWETQNGDGMLEALYQLPDFLLHVGNGMVSLYSAETHPATHDNLPLPSDSTSWQHLRTLEANRAERDPRDLRGWIDPFSSNGQTVLDGAQVRSVRVTESGFRFVLSPTEEFAVVENGLQLPLGSSQSADLIIEYDGELFRAFADTAPDIALTIDTSAEKMTFQPTLLQLQAQNRGVADVTDMRWQVVAEHDGRQTIIFDDAVGLFSAATQREIATWTPDRAGDWTLRAEMSHLDTVLASAEMDVVVSTAVRAAPPLVTSPWRVVLSITVAITALIFVVGRTLYD